MNTIRCRGDEAFSWTLSHTLAADPVLCTVQEALEGLPARRSGEPHVVHDHGSQFVSEEWRLFITATELTDIRTRTAHPESNGRVERLHRTRQEEGLVDAELTDYGQTIDALTRWAHYYNYERPHASLAYLSTGAPRRAGVQTGAGARRTESILARA